MAKMVEVKYRCMHPSCVVNCREGIIGIEEGLLNELSSNGKGEGLFRSPHGICRLGFSQTFKVLSKSEIDSAAAQEVEVLPENNPIAILVAEHKVILKKLAVIEEQLSKRDIDALWVSTVDLENDLNLHSGKKEEEVVLPALCSLMPLAETLVAIIKEDHREVLSVLHAFRDALIEGTIIDGLIRSTIVSLKSHIRKEDNEFFELVDKHLSEEVCAGLIEGMKKIEAEFVPAEPGDRIKLTAERRASAANRAHIDDAFQALRETMLDSCNCH